MTAKERFETDLTAKERPIVLLRSPTQVVAEVYRVGFVTLFREAFFQRDPEPIPKRFAKIITLKSLYRIFKDTSKKKQTLPIHLGDSLRLEKASFRKARLR